VFAQTNNPCNPCAPKNANPCNPCQAKPANPCNPCAPKKANPCNPCSAKPANPCNPCNPCSPGAKPKTTGARLSFGTDYTSSKFEKTTGYVPSASHGDRLVVTFVNPPEAAKIYRANAEMRRAGKTSGFKAFPAGTTIAKPSWFKNAEGKPGKPGPLFVMKKQAKNYDPSGNDWSYGFADPPGYESFGEGFEGPVAFCKACHLAVKNQDFVYAVDR
jgi:hypothetical protein